MVSFSRLGCYFSIVGASIGQDVFLATTAGGVNKSASVVAPFPHNPVLLPTSGASIQAGNDGTGNCYAPDVHYLGQASPRYVMWYGCQGGDGHDRIFWSWSDDLVEWIKFPNDASPQPSLDRGGSNHVNDPSVVQSAGKWLMYYTDAASDIDDRIWLAESSHYTGFKKSAEVLGRGPAGSWDSQKVGRPSVIRDEGIFKMWYDGNDGSTRSVGYATSADGRTWTKHASNPVFLNAGAVDVKRVGNEYWMFYESRQGVYKATSPDGLTWTKEGINVPLSGAAYDQFGTVTPFLLVQNGAAHSVWYAGASKTSWDRNRIAAAFIAPAPKGGGCTACNSAGVSCPSNCASASPTLDFGVCGNPGSTNPGACCACSDDGCGQCVATSCHEICTGAGHDLGFCAHPGSTDPGHCCGCL